MDIGAPLMPALGIAFVLGVRHACDPDHVVAVTSLVAAEGGGVRGASLLGAWWGAGHAAMLLVIGVPLIALEAEMPGWLESGAETAVGLVIVVLAVRLWLTWARDDLHRHLRTPRHAFAIGTLHGLAGTGAVVLLLIAGVGSQAEAIAALAIFASASVASMAACTSALAWVLARPLLAPVYRAVLIPALGAFGLAFGLWYSGVA